MKLTEFKVSDILNSLKKLGIFRLAVLGGVGLALLGSLAAIAIYNGTPRNTLLYADVELNEAAQMVEDLTKAHIPTVTSPDGHSLYVPQNKVAQARLLLAKDGLPGGSAVGYELFDKSGTLTSTQFEQGIDQTRAMEGELERSIRLLRGIRNVRVHLVLPHRDLFSTETNPAQASVILDVGRAGVVSPDAVQAIENLVSAAVPGLQPHNISIVDTRGEVLAQPGDPDTLVGQETSLEKQRHAEEQKLAQSVEDILAPTIGMGHVRARAAVTMNTDLIHEMDESYDPDQQVLRSQSTSSDKSVNSESNPSTTVGNNLPNGNAGQNRTGSSEERSEETNNYEIGKRTREVSQTRPRVSRITIAVMVDGKFDKDAQGKPVWKPLSNEEIDHLTSLVQSTIGYDKERGDQVNIVSMPFKVDNGVDFPETKEPFFTKDMLIYLIEWIVPALLLFGGASMILWPILRHKREEAQAEMEAKEREAERIANGQLPETGNVTVAGIEGEMRREFVTDVLENAEANPEEATKIIRNWLAETNLKTNNARTN